MNSQARSPRPAPSRPAKTASPAIRILLADDHPVIRIGVRNMLQSEEGLEVVGECSDGDEAITQTLELLPDILLLDVYMPRLPGIEAMRAIMNGSPSVKIILLTSTISTQQIIEALQIGARGIVIKDAVAEHVTAAIRAVAGGDYWIGGRRVVNLVGALHELMQQAAVPDRKTFGLLQSRHCQAIRSKRRDRQTPPVEYLRQNWRFHTSRTRHVCNRAPSRRHRALTPYQTRT
jgi:two-component system nitrate/nitrite response regulator NarL